VRIEHAAFDLRRASDRRHGPMLQCSQRRRRRECLHARAVGHRWRARSRSRAATRVCVSRRERRARGLSTFRCGRHAELHRPTRQLPATRGSPNMSIARIRAGYAGPALESSAARRVASQAWILAHRHRQPAGSQAMREHRRCDGSGRSAVPVGANAALSARGDPRRAARPASDTLPP
jgi:hypothetical protein